MQNRAKLAIADDITKPADEIANELMKLHGNEKSCEAAIRVSTKEFHTIVHKNFTDEEAKNKILQNEEVINSFTTNKITVRLILEEPFIKDLNKAVDMTTKDPEVSSTIDKLLANEMGIFRKIKENLDSKDDKRYDDAATNTLKILLDKSNYEAPLILTCKLLHDYVKDKYII